MIRSILIALCVLFLAACQEKFSLDELAGARTTFVVGDTTYLEIVPPYEGFNEPHGILMGNDKLLYVADTRNNRIVQMDIAGQVLGTRSMVRPYA
ncbi:MAG TPA: hypothetical protein DEP53_14925, partial [Bacteroidetes bacterium]|nr:hypothetical protein [Bacteroidota bacterium]